MIEELLDTAHIHLQHATLHVYVDDLKCYQTLFNPVGTLEGEGVLCVSNDWKKEMGFPDFVIDISPKWEECCLSVWVTEGYNEKELADWLRSFNSR